MPAPREILDLVERFAQQLDSYKSGPYNETQLRREFLDPFFKMLGWDMDNSAGYAESYKEVIHEDSIRVGEATKAPDYCFRIGSIGHLNEKNMRDLLDAIRETVHEMGFEPGKTTITQAA